MLDRGGIQFSKLSSYNAERFHSIQLSRGITSPAFNTDKASHSG
jgi:hypothetical protein